MIEDLEIVRNGLVTLMATENKPISISCKTYHKMVDDVIVQLGGEKSPLDIEQLFNDIHKG